MNIDDILTKEEQVKLKKDERWIRFFAPPWHYTIYEDASLRISWGRTRWGRPVFRLSAISQGHRELIAEERSIFGVLQRAADWMVANGATQRLPGQNWSDSLTTDTLGWSSIIQPLTMYAADPPTEWV